MATKSDFVVFADTHDKKQRITEVHDIERSWELAKGISRAKNFSKAAVTLTKRPGKLNDLLFGRGQLVGSPALIAFLQERELKNVEYLPLKVLGPDDAVFDTGYRLIHPIKPVPALDVAKSGASFNADDKSIDAVRRIVLQPGKVKAGVHLFRLAAYWLPVLVHRELAAELLAARFKGVAFCELSQWDPAA